MCLPCRRPACLHAGLFFAFALAQHEAIAFEDTPHGVTAAKAAGLTCVAVPNAITESLDFGQADVVLPSFTAKPLEALLSR